MIFTFTFSDDEMRRKELWVSATSWKRAGAGLEHPDSECRQGEGHGGSGQQERESDLANGGCTELVKDRANLGTSVEPGTVLLPTSQYHYTRSFQKQKEVPCSSSPPKRRKTRRKKLGS